MTISSDLYLAVFAMDAYNQGYSPGINGVGHQIGTAILDTDSSQVLGDGIDKAHGFYAVSYSWNGQRIISYRGTDDISGYAIPSGSDLLRGWSIGAGFAAGTQADDAKLFYRGVTGHSVYDTAFGPSNVVLTGHSLGGGLAGYVSSLTGDLGVMFDYEPYAAAALADALARARQLGISNADFLSGNTAAGSPAFPTLNQYAYFVPGEINQDIRLSAVAATLLAQGLNVDLASAALLAIFAGLADQTVPNTPLDSNAGFRPSPG